MHFSSASLSYGSSTSIIVSELSSLFKLAREENKHKEDNIIDAIAYLVLYNNLIKEEYNES